MVLDIKLCQNHLQTTNQTSYPERVTILNSLYFINFVTRLQTEITIIFRHSIYLFDREERTFYAPFFAVKDNSLTLSDTSYLL